MTQQQGLTRWRDSGIVGTWSGGGTVYTLRLERSSERIVGSNPTPATGCELEE